MSKRYSVLALLTFVALPLTLIAQALSLAIQVDHPTAQVSPMLYGLMTEEINFSYDGGLYAELIRVQRFAAQGGQRRLFSNTWHAIECNAQRRRVRGPIHHLERQIAGRDQQHRPSNSRDTG